MGKHSLENKRRRRREQKKRKRYSFKGKSVMPTTSIGKDSDHNLCTSDTDSNDTAPPFQNLEKCDPLDKMEKMVLYSWEQESTSSCTSKFKDFFPPKNLTVVTAQKRMEEEIDKRKRAEEFALRCIYITKEYKKKLGEVSKSLSEIDTKIHF